MPTKQYMNRGGAADFDREWLYTNAARHCRVLLKPGVLAAGLRREDAVNQVAIDADGMPKGDFDVIILSDYGINAGGTHLVSFEGQGTPSANFGYPYSFVDIPGRPQRYDAATNTTKFWMIVPSGVFDISLTFTNTKRLPGDAPGTGIRKFKVVRPDGIDSATPFAEESLFHPLAISTYELADGHRAMELLKTNDYDPGKDHGWDERPKPATLRMSEGACYEHAVALANASGGGLWLCIPVRATEEHIRKLVRLVLYGSDGVEPYDGPVENPVWAPLADGQEWLVELTANEPWNRQFGAFHYYEMMGQAVPSGTGINYDGACWDPTVARLRFQAEEHVDIADIIRDEAGDALMGTRIKTLIGVQQDYPEGGLLIIAEFMARYWGNLDGQHFPTARKMTDLAWGVATGGYRFYLNTSRDGTVSPETIFASGIPADDTVRQRDIAAAFGWSLVKYETSLSPNTPDINDFQRALVMLPPAAEAVSLIQRDIIAAQIPYNGYFAPTIKPWNVQDNIYTRHAKLEAWLATCPKAGGPIPAVASSTPALAATSPPVVSDFAPGSIVFSRRFKFAAAGRLTIDVPGKQFALGVGLSLRIDGVEVATDTLLASNVVNQFDDATTCYSADLSAPITPGEHTVSVVALKDGRVSSPDKPFRLRVEAGPPVVTQTAVLEFSAPATSYTSATPGPSADGGAEVTAGAGAGRPSTLVVRLAGYDVGYVDQAFVIRKAGTTTALASCSITNIPQIVAPTFAAEIRGGSLVGLIAGREVVRLDGAEIDRAAPVGFAAASGWPAATGPMVASLRQYTLGATAPPVDPTEPTPRRYPRRFRRGIAAA